MALTYLQLVNRVLKALNEPELTSSDFGSAIGFDAEVKDAVNQGILDIYHEEEVRWPWAHTEETFDTEIGVTDYTKVSTVDIVDWDSFQIERPKITVSSLTSTGTTATATTATAHQLAVGDVVHVSGADQTGYNGAFTVVTAPSTTQFTYTVASGLVTPATGTIITRPDYASKELPQITYKVWLNNHKNNDDDRDADDYLEPFGVVRTKDNNIVIVGSPDRVYTIRYDGYAYPDKLVDYDDTTVIPDRYEQLIIDKAMYYAYMFRDNVEQAQTAQAKYKDIVNSARRIEIQRPAYARIGH